MLRYGEALFFILNFFIASSGVALHAGPGNASLLLLVLLSL